jgi:phosphate/sulfate permease
MLFTLIFCTDYKVYWILNLQFSTPVGSGALTLLKASIIACLIYVPGAAFTSKSTVDSLFSDVCKWIFVHKHGQLNTMECSFFHELIWLCHCSFSKKVNQTQDFWCGAW